MVQRDTGEECSTLRSKETLTQATTWMNLENTARSEIQKDKSCMIATLSGVWRGVELTETGSRMVAARDWGRGNGS